MDAQNTLGLSRLSVASNDNKNVLSNSQFVHLVLIIRRAGINSKYKEDIHTPFCLFLMPEGISAGVKRGIRTDAVSGEDSTRARATRANPHEPSPSQSNDHIAHAEHTGHRP